MRSPKDVLVVEDDSDVADAIAVCLEDLGYTVSVAAHGEDALRQLRLRRADRQPNVILLDLMMPVMDGWEFRKEQSADPALAQIPIVVLSAHVDVSQAAERMGAAGWLKKPVNLQALLDAIDRSYDAPPQRGSEGNGSPL